MNTYHKSTLAIPAMLWATTLCAIADTETIGNYTWSYSIRNEEAIVTGVSPSTGTIKIPSTLNGCNVTSIGDEAFYGCSGLKSVTIPDSVTSIGKWAFSGCSGLKSVTIGNSVTRIGSYAFYGCSGLTSVTIPDSVTSIGDSAFEECSGLKSVTIGNSVTSIGGWAFRGCSGLKSVTIPDSVTSIGNRAFSGCSGLTSVTIPDSVTSIGSYAFSGCSASLFDTTTLPGVKLVDGWVVGYDNSLSGNLNLTGIRGIGGSAFEYCSSLKSVAIPDSVTRIEGYAFSDCSGLESVTIPNSVTSIGKWAFSGCSASLFDITTLPGVKLVDGWVVGYDNSLSGNLNLTGIRGIGGGAFYNCSGLTSVTIPDSVTSIGYEEFYGCSGLTSVTIPDSVTSIEGYAFSDCRGLESVTIPNSVTSIGDSAFRNCSGLTAVTIGSGVTSIGSYAFGGCHRIIAVNIANLEKWNKVFFHSSSANPLISRGSETKLFLRGLDVTEQDTTRRHISMDDIASYCRKSYADEQYITVLLYDVHNPTYDAMSLSINGVEVRDLVIPDGIGEIGYAAFFRCHAIRTVTIPASVTNIQTAAFVGCSGLRAFYVDPANPTYCSRSGMLYSKDGKTLICGKNGDVVIPEGTTHIARWAFVDYHNLTSLAIPTSLVCIGSCAFRGCDVLDTVSITDLAAWCGVTFASHPNDDEEGQPLRHARRLLVNGEPITELTIPAEVEHINNGSFAYCPYIAKAFVPMATQISGAFSGTTTIVRYNPIQTIVLDTNGGGGVPGEITRDYGATYGDLPTPAKADCLFAGWTVAGNPVSADSLVAVPTNHTLVAMWKNKDNVAATTGRPVVWKEGGEGSGWLAVADLTAKDGYCLRSGVVSAGEVSAIETTLEGPGMLTFAWRISSGRGDFARIYLDDNVQQSISRVEGWATVELSVPAGTHAVRWSYERGSGSAVGEDAAFLDDVDWRPEVTLSVSSAYGAATPSAGAHTLVYGDVVVASVATMEIAGTRHVCTGWTGTGSVSENGAGDSVSFTITNDSSIAWNWRTEHWTEIVVSGGSSDFSSRWIVAGESVAATLSTSALRYEMTLSGDAEGVALDGMTLRFVADRPRRIDVEITEVNVPLAVHSAHGIPSPANGIHSFPWGSVVSGTVQEPEPTNGVRYVCTGWTGTGDVPAEGARTNVVFILETTSSLTWNWTTNIWISLALSGPVATDFTNQWTELGGAIVADLAVSAPHCAFALLGDTDGVVLDEVAMTLSIPLDRPRSLALAATELTLAGVLDGKSLIWTTDGAATWFPQMTISRDGVAAACSGPVVGDDSSGLETTLKGSGIFSWSWRLDMALGGNAGVDVFLDGVWLEDYAPTGEWAEESLEIEGEGEHSIRFEFWNAGTGAESACAFIDQVSFGEGEEEEDPPQPPLIVQKFTVTFNANGGKGGTVLTLDYGAELVAPAVARTGYILTGWSPAVPPAMPAADTSYVAQWKASTYKVVFNANGGQLPEGKTMAAQVMTYDKAAALRKNAYVRSGCVFIGWAVKKGGAIAYKNAQSVKNLNAKGGTVTLYAVWAKKTYKVAFNANGGTGKMAVEAFAYGKAKNLTANKFTAPKGMVFAGWALKKGGAVVFANAAAVKNLTVKGGTITLYAVWAKPTYKVAFYAYGGTGNTVVQTFKYGKAARLAACKFIAPKDYVFAGWATSAANAKKGKIKYKNKAKVKNLLITGKTVKLYAVWKK